MTRVFEEYRLPKLTQEMDRNKLGIDQISLDGYRAYTKTGIASIIVNI